MKPNKIRQRLAAGEIPFGHMIMEFATRGIARVVEGAGLDFVVIDMEHGGNDIGMVADLLAWFQAVDVTPLVRTPGHDYDFVARVMDAGAAGIMAPNVQTAEQAAALNAAMRYAPAGARGLGLGTAHNGYRPPQPDAAGYMREANERNVLICQIESVTALDNLEDIASTPGVDVLWVGQWDLTQTMGIAGQLDAPEFLGALAKVVDTAKRHGLAAGIQPGSLPQARAWMDVGYNVISYGADFGVYQSALRSAVSELRG